MVKHLINKLKGKIRRGIFIATAGLFLQGCPFPEPPPEYPTAEPTAIVTAYPTAEPTAAPTQDNDYMDISGRLEDNEEDIGRGGVLRVYNASDPAVLTAIKDGNFSAITPLKEIATDPYGYFSMTLDQLNSELPDGVVLRAKIGEGDERTSYVRTITESSGDKTDITMRAVPYPTFDTNGDGVINQVDYQNFKTHFQNTNVTYSKWDTLNKIKIFIGEGATMFDEVGIENIKNKIKDHNNIEQFVEGRELDDLIEVVDGLPPSDFEDGCIQVAPDNDIAYGNVGVTYIKRIGRNIVGARIHMNTDVVGMDNPVTTHEFGHTLIAPDGHSSLPDELTIMKPTGNILLQPGVADIKSAKIVKEDTFLAGDYNWTRVMNSMLGMSW